MTAIQLPGVFLDTSILDKIGQDADRKASEVVEKYGFTIAGEAAIQAPVDTGALRNSIPAESKMVDTLTFRVQDGVEYGVYQELGTSRMAALPFITPAIEKWRDKFLDAFFELFT